MPNEINLKAYYQQRMIEDAKNWLDHLKIDATMIKETPNDAELGALIRKMYSEKVKQAEETLKTLKDAKP
jgi:hypothetical protein